MRLPYAEMAYIDDQKLVGYCLSETHTTGKHKACVFRAVLGITATEYELLKDAILNAVLQYEAYSGGNNQQGDLYTVDFRLTHADQTATVRTAWIACFGESFPRLVSCYVKR